MLYLLVYFPFYYLFLMELKWVYLTWMVIYLFLMNYDWNFKHEIQTLQTKNKILQKKSQNPLKVMRKITIRHPFFITISQYLPINKYFVD